MAAFLALIFCISFLITADLVPWAIRRARRTGFLDLPGPRKIHEEPIPYGGGLAVAAGMLCTLGLGIAAAWLHAHHGAFRATPPEVAITAPHVLARLPTLLVYATGSLVILAMGVVDDRRKLYPSTKLLAQAIVAMGVALGGERLKLFEAGGVAGGAAVTVLWIVVVTNAFNLLDHMDGLCAGVAGISCLAFLAVALQTGQIPMAGAVTALLGACAGFLLFNFPPARIFLGDAGSQFIGFWLACLTISFTFYERAAYRAYTYLVPVAVLAVPLFDAGCVAVLRLLRGRPIFEGDTNHFAHRLTALGMSRRMAVSTVYAVTLLTGLSAILLYQVNNVGALVILSQLAMTFAIITLLEAAARAREP